MGTVAHHYHLGGAVINDNLDRPCDYGDGCDDDHYLGTTLVNDDAPTTLVNDDAPTTLVNDDAPTTLVLNHEHDYPWTRPNQPSWGVAGASNTGPIGTLTVYTGPCTISAAGTTISNAILNCSDLNINAANVTIRNSQINGSVDMNSSGTQFLDVLVVGNSGAGAVDGSGFTIVRSEIRGGNRQVWCNSCTLRDSWLHGNSFNAGDHGSAVRADQYSTIIHNTLHCEGDPCSANLTGYPDFQTSHHWTIDGNLFVGSFGATLCAYGGDSPNKPYSDDPDNATYIRFTNNTFQRGPSGQCGFYGHITHFTPTNTGNVWSGNVWDDGGTAPPD